MSEDPSVDLPRLLYIGDVPVEASYHGSALLYRLLQTYPRERLRIVEAGLEASRPDRRLAGVEYRQVPLKGRRLLSTRFHRQVSSFFSLLAPWRAGAMRAACKGFQPEAVLTVAHGYSWMTAAAFARRHRLPLHFIVHDDWPRAILAPRRIRLWVDRQFARCYREAASRLCVSPYMAEEYQQRYGVEGTVLYPSRALNAPSYESPPERLAKTAGRPLVFAFGGTINSGGHVQALRDLAAALESIGGRLHLYGPISREAAEAGGLLRENVELMGLVPSEEFIARMREEADVLFAPMSFEEQERANMSLCFPSKLTDYTAAGLPILIHGPDYSSAVRWAKDHPGVAVVVTATGVEALRDAVMALIDVSRRQNMAACAMKTGKAVFGHKVVFQVFQEAITDAMLS